MKYFLLIFTIFYTLNGFASGTYVKTPTRAITAFTITNTTIGNGDCSPLFQASSTAGVITRISGYFSHNGPNSGDFQFAIGPTSCAAPSTTNGTIYFGNTSLSYRRAGITMTSPGIPATSTIYNFGNVSVSGDRHVMFDDFVIVPGYFVYVYGTYVPTTTGGWEIQRIVETN